MIGTPIYRLIIGDAAKRTNVVFDCKGIGARDQGLENNLFFIYTTGE